MITPVSTDEVLLPWACRQTILVTFIVHAVEAYELVLIVCDFHTYYAYSPLEDVWMHAKST